MLNEKTTVDSSIKNKLKNYPFVINWDTGERYHQIHLFEDADGLSYVKVSSKINKEGKIELRSRASKKEAIVTATSGKPVTEEEFKEMIDMLKSNLEKAGYSYRFIDLSQCSDPLEVMQLITKSDPRFKVEIKT